MTLGDRAWRAVAHAQANVVTRAQLTEHGADARFIRRRLNSGDWQAVGPRVVVTAPGALSQDQRVRAAMCHPRGPAVLTARKALTMAGLRGWDAGPIVILIGAEDRSGRIPLDDVIYVRSRRDLSGLTTQRGGLRITRVEPAALLLASAFASGHWGERRWARASGGIL
ncbi:MAG: hypothetical protein QM673_15015, partial [Gordonia sp. (in: high G+C Gram-positive bacteria)]